MRNHYSTCNSNYPEKPPDEAPRQLQHVDLGDGVWVKVCVDCGATVEAGLSEDGKE